MAFGDPASGQRFIVGVQTPWNQNTLGFGLTPEETLARKRRQMAAALGVSLSDEEASSLPENVIQQLGMRQIQSRQQEADDARQQQQMEARYRILENQRQQQDQAETMRWRQYLDSEDPMHTHATPAEKDAIAADPKLRQDYLQQRQQQRQYAHVEAQQALKNEIARKNAATTAQGLKTTAPPQYHAMIDELAQQGQPAEAIVARMKEREQGDRQAAAEVQRRERETALAERQQRMEAEKLEQDRLNAEYEQAKAEKQDRERLAEKTMAMREREHEQRTAEYEKRVREEVKARNKSAESDPALAEWKGLSDEDKYERVRTESAGSAPTEEEVRAAREAYEKELRAPSPRRGVRAAAEPGGLKRELASVMEQLNPDWQHDLARRMSGKTEREQRQILDETKRTLGLR